MSCKILFYKAFLFLLRLVSCFFKKSLKKPCISYLNRLYIIMIKTKTHKTRDNKMEDTYYTVETGMEMQDTRKYSDKISIKTNHDTGNGYKYIHRIPYKMHDGWYVHYDNNLVKLDRCRVRRFNGAKSISFEM